MAFLDRTDLGFKVWLAGQVVVVRWLRVIDTASAAEINSILREHRSQVAGAIHYIGIQDSSSMGLSGDESRVSAQAAKELLQVVEDVQLVVEGDGVGASLLRTSFRALIATARVSPDVLGIGELRDQARRTTLAPDLRRALENIATVAGIDAGATLADLTAAGMTRP